MSQKFLSVWDDTKTVTGSVYLTPTYSSGPESGSDMRTAPATLHVTAGQGLPARHLNYALFSLGNNAVQVAQHQAMRFTSGKDWTSAAVQCVGVARSNRGFIVGCSTTVHFIREPRGTGASAIMVPAVGAPKVVHDDGFHIGEFENSGATVEFASSSTVSGTVFTGTSIPYAAGSIGNKSMLLATSGTSLIAFTYTGTATAPTVTTVSVPGGTYNVSSTALWGKAQIFVGANTATGPLIFYSKGNVSNNGILSSDAVTVAGTADWSGITTNKLADISYDAEQALFVAAGYSSTGSVVEFFTSADSGTTWTASATASGPTGLSVITGATDGTVAFTICAGVWFLAITSSQFANYVFGSSGGSGKRVLGMYSLDYGVTWYPADLDMAVASSGATLRAISSVDQILVKHDSDVALSGRLGYSEAL